MIDLSIVIVSYNTERLLRNCLKSVQESVDSLEKEVIIIDNASTDGSVEMVRREFPDCRVIINKENFGFGMANNVGAREAKGDYLLFLNSDTTVFKDTLVELINSVRKSGVRVASCRLVNPNGSIQPQGGFLPRLSKIAAWMLFLDDLPMIGDLIRPYQQRRKHFFERDQILGWVSGTALLVERDLFFKLSGFDEKIFMYGEDLEFCYRAKKAGEKVYYFAKPIIKHMGHGSGGREQAILGEYRGLKYFFGKHKPAWEWPFLRVLLKLGAWLRMVVFGIILGDGSKKAIYQKAFDLA